ncbi:alcohol dehydrogenase catalytic domain-containing protein [Sphingomonas sp. UYP23]
MSAPTFERGRRIVHYRYGDPHTVLKVEEDVRTRSLEEGEVLVRVVRSMIHPGDLQLVAAKYSDPTELMPDASVPGLEAAGVIVDAAPGALQGVGLVVGARVAFFAPGAWQTYAVVPANALVALPDELTYELATQVLINTIIARHVLRTALSGLPAKPRHIVQTGASSAVGMLLTVLALKEGIAPIRLVRSSRSAARLIDKLPGGQIIDTGLSGWQSQVRDASDNHIPLVLDGVGGAMVGEIGSLLAMHGRMVSYGLLGDAPADLTLFSAKGLSLVGVTIGTWAQDTTPEDQVADQQTAIDIGLQMPELFADHSIFNADALGDAISAVGAATKTGNVLLAF